MPNNHIKTPHFGVLDVNVPSVILFTDDKRAAETKAAEADNYYVISMAVHPKKGGNQPKPPKTPPTGGGAQA